MRDFLQKFKEMNITSVRLINGRCHVKLSGYPIPSKIVKTVKTEPSVGSHFYGGGKKVFNDDDLYKNLHTERDRKIAKLSINAHECIEDWLRDFFPDKTEMEIYPAIHNVSEFLEKKWHIKKYGIKSWNRYMRAVNKVYDKENM